MKFTILLDTDDSRDLDSTDRLFNEQTEAVQWITNQIAGWVQAQKSGNLVDRNGLTVGHVQAGRDGLTGEVKS